MEHKKNICFYVLDVILCGMLFTACGAQEPSADDSAEQVAEEQTNPYNLEILNVTDEDDTEDVNLSEEQLYWIDNEARVTVLENPTRRFVEVRAIDTERAAADGGGVVPYFGMLKEAVYEVLIYDQVPMLEIKFSYAEGSLDAGYEMPLYNGHCMVKNYKMTVTDKVSGEVLQEDTVRLCIDQFDMITFGDMNKDRYIDMKIDYPSHQDETYPTKWWDYPLYMLWNTELEIFEYKTEREVRGSLHDHIDMITKAGSREYVVQPGDCLWSISERFLGSGFNWTMLQREENASKDPNYLLPGEIIDIPNGINFP